MSDRRSGSFESDVRALELPIRAEGDAAEGHPSGEGVFDVLRSAGYRINPDTFEPPYLRPLDVAVLKAICGSSDQMEMLPWARCRT